MSTSFEKHLDDEFKHGESKAAAHAKKMLLKSRSIHNVNEISRVFDLLTLHIDDKLIQDLLRQLDDIYRNAAFTENHEIIKTPQLDQKIKKIYGHIMSNACSALMDEKQENLKQDIEEILNSLYKDESKTIYNQPAEAGEWKGDDPNARVKAIVNFLIGGYMNQYILGYLNVKYQAEHKLVDIPDASQNFSLVLKEIMTLPGKDTHLDYIQQWPRKYALSYIERGGHDKDEANLILDVLPKLKDLGTVKGIYSLFSEHVKKHNKFDKIFTYVGTKDPRLAIEISSQLLWAHEIQSHPPTLTLLTSEIIPPKNQAETKEEIEKNEKRFIYAVKLLARLGEEGRKLALAVLKIFSGNDQLTSIRKNAIKDAYAVYQGEKMKLLQRNYSPPSASALNH